MSLLEFVHSFYFFSFSLSSYLSLDPRNRCQFLHPAPSVCLSTACDCLINQNQRSFPFDTSYACLSSCSRLSLSTLPAPQISLSNRVSVLQEKYEVRPGDIAPIYPCRSYDKITFRDAIYHHSSRPCSSTSRMNPLQARDPRDNFLRRLSHRPHFLTPLCNHPLRSGRRLLLLDQQSHQNRQVQSLP